MLGYSVASSLILTFITSIEQFAIPALIGSPGHINVLATQLYLLVRFSPPDYGLAAAIGLTLSAITGLAIWSQRSVISGARLATVTGKAGRLEPIRLGRWKWPANFVAFGFAFLALILPAVILIYTSVIKFFVANPFDGALTRCATTCTSGRARRHTRSFWNTLVASGDGRSARRCARFSGLLLHAAAAPRAAIGSSTSSPACPSASRASSSGLGLLWAYAYLPLPLYGTLAIIIIAYITRYLPYATETIGGQMVQIDKSLEEAAWVSGATRMRDAVARSCCRSPCRRCRAPTSCCSWRSSARSPRRSCCYTASTTVMSISIWSFFEQANWGLASALVGRRDLDHLHGDVADALAIAVRRGARLSVRKAS